MWESDFGWLEIGPTDTWRAAIADPEPVDLSLRVGG